MVDGENEKSRIVTQSLEQLGDVELLQATETAETPNNARRGNHIGPPQLLGDPWASTSRPTVLWRTTLP